MSQQQERPLAQLLIQVGMEKIQRSGKSMTRMELLAHMTWDFVLDGFIKFPDDPRFWATSRDWVSTLKWLHELIDGRQPRPATKSPAKPAPPPLDLPIPQVGFPLARSRR